MKNILTLTACAGLLWLGIQSKTQGQEIPHNLIADYYPRNGQAQLYQRRQTNYPARRNYYYNNNRRVQNNDDCERQSSSTRFYPRQRYNNYRDNRSYRHSEQYYRSRGYYYPNYPARGYYYPSNGLLIEYYQD
jgi:hypothetical protein